MINHRLQLTDLTQQQKIWVAKAAAGAVLADGEIMEGRLNRLAELFDLMNAKSEEDKAAKATLMLHGPPILDSIELTPLQAKEIFRFLLYIMTSSLLMGQGTVTYIHQTARILKIDKAESKSMVEDFLLHQKGDFFHEIIQDLEPKHRQWLATAMIKLIYADNRVDRYEMPYLNYLGELAPGNLSELKELAQRLALTDVDLSDLSAKERRNLFIFLANISLKPTGFEPKALAVAKEAAQAAKLPASQCQAILGKLKTRVLLL